MRKLRFCMVTTFYPPYHFGGDGIFVRALSESLANLGHHVTIVHCEDAYRLKVKEKLSEPLEHKNIRTVRIRHPLGAISPLITQQFGRPGLKYNVLKRVLEEPYDVVNFHNISLVGGPSVLRMSNAAVTLYSLHEHWLVCPTHILWKYGKKACDGKQCVRCCLVSGVPPQLWRYGSTISKSLSNVDLLLAPSQYTYAQHQPLHSYVDLTVLPLFSHLSSAQSVEHPIGQSQYLAVGRITASKGIPELVASFSKWPDYKLVVAGDGEELGRLRQKFGAFSNISFVGSVPQKDLIRLYQTCTAVILPSLAPESFGLTVVEAFSCGVPAVVRRAGGNTEAIEKYAAGYSYRTEDELREVLDRFAADPRLRGQLGARGRRAYETEYNRDTYLQRYLELIADVASSKGVKLGNSEKPGRTLGIEQQNLVLSVIIADEHSTKNLGIILQRLNPPGHPDVEYIICSPRLPKNLSKSLQLPNVHWLPASSQTRVPYLCRDGIRAARAEKVALITGHMIPNASWIHRVLDTPVNQKNVGYGGSIRTSGRVDMLEIAIYLLRYVQFSPGRKKGAVTEIAADNAVYFRTELIRYHSLLEQGFWEPSFHEIFHESGQNLEFDPEIAVVYRNRYRAQEFLGQRYIHGKSNGVTRGKSMHFFEKVLRILAFPLVSILVVVKSIAAADTRHLEKSWQRSLLLLQLFSFAWCAGEAVGYCHSLLSRSIAMGMNRNKRKNGI